VQAAAEPATAGTTRLARLRLPLRPGGRLVAVANSVGMLFWLAPVPNDQFRHLATLDAIDAETLAWRDAVRNGSAFYGGWPAFVNVPSKIAKVAAVRELAAQRRDSSSGEGRIAGSTWRPVPEPAFASMPPRGQAWEAARYRAYQAQVTDRTMGDLRPGRSSSNWRPRASLPSPTPAARLDAETLPRSQGNCLLHCQSLPMPGPGQTGWQPWERCGDLSRAAVPVSPSGAVG
jgi:hypothetical protein